MKLIDNDQLERNHTSMASRQSQSPQGQLRLPQDLGDGLLLRLGTKDDLDPLAEFNKQIHEAGHDPENSLAIWTRDLLSGTHPTTSAADFVVVEDRQAKHKIVSTTCLIPQTWAYEGINFPVGRPELVGTDPAYRNRGLTKAIFQQIHALSDAYGHLVQGITGIPWFYRQFGYEYALRLGGGRPLFAGRVPTLEKDETEPYQVRPAMAADIPILERLYNQLFEGYAVTAVIDEERWRYDLSGRSPGSIQELKTYCLLENEQVIGYYVTPSLLWGKRIALLEIMIESSVSWRQIVPTVMRTLLQQGQAMLETDHEEDLEGVYIALHPDHPVHEVLKQKLGPVNQPYAWYIRVPDLPAFIRHIRPALEKRLAASIMSGFSSQVNLNFYRDGLKLHFKDGRLIEAAAWLKPDADSDHKAGASFPPLVFLQLLFGHRSLEELRYAFPDCWANDETALLLEALFPKRSSWVQPLG